MGLILGHFGAHFASLLRSCAFSLFFITSNAILESILYNLGCDFSIKIMHFHWHGRDFSRIRHSAPEWCIRTPLGPLLVPLGVCWALLGTSWGAEDDQDDAQMGPDAPKVAQKAAKVAQKAPKMRSGRPRKDPKSTPMAARTPPRRPKIIIKMASKIYGTYDDNDNDDEDDNDNNDDYDDYGDYDEYDNNDEHDDYARFTRSGRAPREARGIHVRK